MGTEARSSWESAPREDITEEVRNPAVIEEAEDDESGEGIRAKGAVVPTMPSQEEVEAA